MSGVEDLVAKVRAYHSGADAGLIRRAYDFSREVHRGQRRQSGEPYFVHPVGVAGLIADLRLDVPSVVTGLLHDTVEDTLTTLAQIQTEFGEEVAALVDGVTKISQVNFTSREEKQAENFRKMVLAMARDIRVILVKLADRTDNMRTLNHLSPERQREISQETVDIYAPIAHRLGVSWIKNELEDAALRYLRPEVYYQLKRNVAKKKGERTRYINEFSGVLTKKLNEAGIEAEVSGRPKHFYSIYGKMQRENLLYDQIYDLVGFRIVVDTLTDCYAALGVVHANWKPVPGRFKDYIALPKNNMYQSLHTTVIGLYGERVEVQIRTHEMHRVAEFGIAAHWKYKEGGQSAGAVEAQRFAWLRQLLEWQQNVSDPQEFLGSVKEDLFSDEVFVFTPKGDVLNFPEGASVIDFAYRIHSEVGHHCAGARVNGRMVPLRYRLRNGDTVEIVTTANQTPSKDWLNHVKTSRAKARIRGWLRYQQRSRSLAVGREILERDLSRHHLDFKRLQKDGKLTEAAHALSQKDEETLIAGVGYGKITTAQVLGKLMPAEELARRAEREEGTLRKLFRRMAGQGTGVQVSGVEDVLVRFGRCCDPLPGERILGFITRGRGVTVHALDCPRVLESDPQRRIEVVWQSGANGARAVNLEVVCVDEPGMLAAITKSISGAGVNITRAQVQSTPDKQALNSFEIMVGTADQLNRVIRAIGKLRGVIRVSRPRA
jgi:GTP pyrophosphokinase